MDWKKQNNKDSRFKKKKIASPRLQEEDSVGGYNNSIQNLS